MDLTEGIRAERERIAGVIAGLESQLAKWNAADRELADTEVRLERLNLGGLTVPVRTVEKGSAPGRRASREEARPLIEAHLEKVGRATGTSNLAQTLDLTKDTTFGVIRELEAEGRVTVKRDGKKPMDIRWVGAREESPKPVAKRAPRRASPKGEARRRVERYLTEHPRVSGMKNLAEGAGVPTGSMRGVMVELEREGRVRIIRHGPQKPVDIVYSAPDGTTNGAASAQTATV